MNWTKIDNSTEATEVKGAGCFVRFFGSQHACFAPSTTIKIGENGAELVAVNNCITQIMFTSGSDGETSTSSYHWIGDAGDKLDKKLAALEKKKAMPAPVAKVDKKKFKAMKFRNKVKRKRVGRKIISERTDH